MRYVIAETPDDLFEFERRREEFLLKIAQEVDRLITNKKILDRFRDQVAVFVRKVNVCRAGDYPSGQAASAGWPYLLAPVLARGSVEIPAPQDQRDLLPDHYFLLALIHDRRLPLLQFVPINNGIYDTEGDVVKSLWDYYGRLTAGPETQARIEVALERIKADVGQLANALEVSIPTGFLSAAQLAERYGIKNKEGLRKHLERHRAKHKLNADLFVECQDRGKNQPKFLYNHEQVAPIVREFGKRDSSDSRPTGRK